MHAPGFLADLAVVLLVASATAMLSRALGQPTVLGYLVAGLIVGPYLPIPVFADPGRTHALSELGVVLVMFIVGLELRLKRLVAVLPTAGVNTVGEGVGGYGEMEVAVGVDARGGLGAGAAVAEADAVAGAHGDEAQAALVEHGGSWHSPAALNGR